MKELVTHTFNPVYNKNSKILILGTMPSPASRNNGFYYGHPQNRFWAVICAVLEKPVPTTPEEKTSLLLKANIALWDVLKQCTIEQAADSSIRQPVPNDLNLVFKNSNIGAVFCNGKAAFKLYKQFFSQESFLPVFSLPSTSPANARCSLQNLIEEYRAVLPFLS